ncbi:MAG: winged helix-turn-helix transcriptional regulator [Shimia sp.]
MPSPMPETPPAYPSGGTCPVEATLRMMSGKWSLMVLFHLRGEPVRFNALQRRLAPITQRVLAATLKRLEADGLIWRRSEGTVPPHVTYGLTERGTALAPVWEAMAIWGTTHARKPDPAA